MATVVWKLTRMLCGLFALCSPANVNILDGMAPDLQGECDKVQCLTRKQCCVTQLCTDGSCCCSCCG